MLRLKASASAPLHTPSSWPLPGWGMAREEGVTLWHLAPLRRSTLICRKPGCLPTARAAGSAASGTGTAEHLSGSRRQPGLGSPDAGERAVQGGRRDDRHDGIARCEGTGADKHGARHRGVGKQPAAAGVCEAVSLWVRGGARSWLAAGCCRCCCCCDWLPPAPPRSPPEHSCTGPGVGAGGRGGARSHQRGRLHGEAVGHVSRKKACRVHPPHGHMCADKPGRARQAAHPNLAADERDRGHQAGVVPGAQGAERRWRRGWGWRRRGHWRHWPADMSKVAGLRHSTQQSTCILQIHHPPAPRIRPPSVQTSPPQAYAGAHGGEGGGDGRGGGSGGAGAVTPGIL